MKSFLSFAALILFNYYAIGHMMLAWYLPYASDLSIYCLLSLFPVFFLGLCTWFVIDDRKCYLKAEQVGGIDKTRFQEDETQKHSINIKC